MNPDGISYLDISDGVLSGEWSRFVNAYWSPLYPALLGFVRLFLPREPALLFPIVHLANFVAFLGVWASTEYAATLWNESDRERPDGVSRISKSVLFGAFVTWCAISQIGLGVVAPDLLLLAVAIAAMTAGLKVVRSRSGVAFTVLCFLLAIGYLAKAVFLLTGLAALALAILAVATGRFSLRSFLPGFLLYVTLVGCWVAVLSNAKGRLTTGDVGPLAFTWYVNSDAPVLHWQGDRPEAGVAVHPTTRVMSEPPVFFFGDPFDVTFPPWFDPSYFNEGRRPSFDARKIVSHARAGLLGLASIVMTGPGYLIGILFLAVAWRFPGRERALESAWDFLRPAVVWLPALVPLVALVIVHVEARLVGPFLAALFLGLLFGAGADPGKLDGSSRFAEGWISRLCLTAALLMLSTLYPIFGNGQYPLGRPVSGRPAILAQSDLARRTGIGPTSRVAVAGEPFQHYWARLAGARIVAHINLPLLDLCRLEASKRDAVVRVLKEKGCDVIAGFVELGAQAGCGSGGPVAGLQFVRVDEL